MRTRIGIVTTISGCLIVGALSSIAYGGSPHVPPVASDARGEDCERTNLIPCSGVRPGAALSIKDGYGCTMNFLFKGSDGRTYAGTGGHCIFDGEGVHGERTWKPGQGMETYDAGGNRIGETAYWILDLGKFDFSLIRLDRDVDFDPQMCHFGGPTGIYKGTSNDAATINFFGNLSDVGKVLPARNFIAATGFPHRHNVDAFGVAVFGDSGGPATLNDGKALGVAVGTGFGFSSLPGQSDFTAGNVFLVRLPPQIKEAERALGIDLRILKAPAA